MDEYINHMFEAFGQIHQRYYFTETIQNINRLHEPPELVIQSTEASFTAELFRHWRNIMELPENAPLYTDLSIDLDVTKRAWHPAIVGNQRGYRPDIVLHQSQTQLNSEYQMIYGEVKTTFSPNVELDIRKIANALSLLHFQNGVFISVNSNIDELMTLINTSRILIDGVLDGLGYNVDWSRVYLMHANQNVGNHSITSFNNI